MYVGKFLPFLQVVKPTSLAILATLNQCLLLSALIFAMSIFKNQRICEIYFCDWDPATKKCGINFSDLDLSLIFSTIIMESFVESSSRFSSYLYLMHI